METGRLPPEICPPPPEISPPPPPGLLPPGGGGGDGGMGDTPYYGVTGMCRRDGRVFDTKIP